MAPEHDKRRRDASPDGRRGRSRSASPRESRHEAKTSQRDRSRRRGRPHSRSRSPLPERRRRSPSRSRSKSGSPGRRTGRHHPSRSRSQSRERDKRKRRRSRSRSRSRSSSSSGDDRRNTRRKEKRRKRSSSRDKKTKKKDKKHKKDKKKKDKEPGGVHWGKYGIITESDLYNKEPEFRTWLVEERVINPETISKDATKKEFARFMEDYNTATLPHEKFYNLDKYERRMDLLRSGETLPPVNDDYDPNADLLAHTSAHKRNAGQRESYLSKDQLQELRKVQQERTQVGKMKLLGMDIKQSMGVRMVDAD